ncbi:hypothetical protein M378DRAFT_158426 [Amanita muscaria Koide BX008]|uniref:RRM domain-containing protein n=1 Tax=Amanita muscaria (strain Koide BX008) TaxID=946122 RepID=A0A0C2XI15_AMAMK|nr:hypothetical protein M378DRAFT_158426 [Amanita muscaria Koide BX008]
MSGHAAWRAAQELQRQALSVGSVRKSALKYGKHIEISQIPPTATTADIRRTIDRTKLQGVKDVALVFNHFRPTGTALISLTRPEYLKNNLKMLGSASIASKLLKFEPRLLDDADTALPRSRGAKGREEAATRGAMKGNGAHAGITNGERTVTIWGFPGKTDVPAVEFILRSFDLARNKDGKASAYKVMLPEEEFSMYSRFIVTLANVSEAHHLVRQINMTHFEPETLGNRFILRARIVN